MGTTQPDVSILYIRWFFRYFYINAPSDAYDTNKQNAKSTLLFFGIFFTIMAIVLGIVLIWSRKKIHLVILLLKETTKAVFDMPGLIIIPVFVSNIIIYSSTINKYILQFAECIRNFDSYLNLWHHNLLYGKRRHSSENHE